MLKLSLILIVFTLNGFALFAQEKDVRLRLNNLKEIGADTVRINIYNKSAEDYYNINVDSTFKYGKLAKELSERMNYKLGLIAALRNIGSYYNSNKYYDYEKAKKTIEEATKLAEEIGDTRELTKVYHLHSMVYYYGNDYTKTLQHAEKSISFAKKLNDNYLLGISLLTKGESLFYLGKYSDAMSSFHEAYELMEKAENRLGMILAKGNISALLNQLGEFNKALENYKELLKMLTKDLNYSPMAIYYNMGNLYYELKQYQNAIEHFLKASKAAKEYQKMRSIPMCELAAAKVYAEIKEYEKADKHLNVAFKYLKGNQDKYVLRESYNLAADIKIQFGNYDLAIEYLLKSMELAKGDPNLVIKAHNNHLLSIAYEKKGDIKKSFEYFKLYHELSDSLSDKDISAQLAEMQTKYETKIKEKENVLLKKDKELHKEKINEQYIMIFAVSIALLFSVVLTIILVNHNSKRKKMIKTLEEQKEQIETYAEALNQSNIAKDKFFSIVAHDLKNPFHSLLMMLSVISEGDSSLDLSRIQELSTKMLSSTKNAYALLENLLHWSRSHLGKMEFEPDVFDLNDVIEQNIELVNNLIEEKNISLKKNTVGNTVVYSDENMINLVIRNLITNALKFTRPNGEIEIKAEEKDDHVLVSVSDSGVGIPQELQEKIFKLSETTTTKGTNNEVGTGLGLILCKEFIEKQNGKIWFESKENIGTQFYFTIPKAAV